MRLRWPAAILLLLGTSGPLAAEEYAALRLSLPEALRLASRRHMEVLVANDRIDQALARLNQARSVLLPTLSAEAAQTRQTRNLDASGIKLPGSEPVVGPFDTLDARLTVSQTLFDAAAIQRLRAARAGRELSLAQREQITQDILFLVTTLYWNAKRAANGLEAAKAALDYSAAQLDLARSRTAWGVGSREEQTQAEAQYAVSIHAWQTAIQEAVERQLDLTAALGLPSAGHLVLTQTLTLEAPVVAEPSFSAIAAAAASHPKQRVADENVAVKRAERAAQKSEWLPTLSVTGDYGASGRRPDDSEATYSYGGRLRMPLFQGGLRVARVAEASSVLKEAQERAQDTKHSTQADIFSAIEVMRSSAALVEAQRQLFIAAQEQLNLARRRLSAGTGSRLETLNASAQAFKAKDGYEAAVANYYVAEARLAHALGQIKMPGGAS